MVSAMLKISSTMLRTALLATAFVLASCQMPLRQSANATPGGPTCLDNYEPEDNVCEPIKPPPTISHEFFDGLKLIKESWTGSWIRTVDLMRIDSLVFNPEPHPLCLHYEEANGLLGLIRTLDMLARCTWAGSTWAGSGGSLESLELLGFKGSAVLAEFAEPFNGKRCVLPRVCIWPTSPIKPRWTDDFPGISIFLTEPPTVVVWRNRGGEYQKHIKEWRTVAAEGSSVEIRGLCDSGCTLVTAYVPKDRLCFGERASLNIHQVRIRYGESTVLFPDPKGSQEMIDSYPPDIRNWILAKGGLAKMPGGNDFWKLHADDLWQMGYRKCAD
jgi:hypothetical protein